MRSIATSLMLFGVLAVIVLLVALLAALGIGGLGWLMARIFGLTQWQGSLIAMGAFLGSGWLVYQLAGVPPPLVSPPEYDDWEEDAEPEEPPVVPWRQHRPTPGQLKEDKPGPERGKRSKK